jgi:hypothetical protein
MASVTGDDREWQLSGYGVLGTGTPRTIPTQDGTEDVDSYGVWGLLGTPDDIGGIVDEVTSNESFGAGPLRAAIVGRNALPDQGAAIYGEATPLDAATSSFGFIAGRSPYAGEVTGVFGQGGTRGVIGIAEGSDGIGVYGGSVAARGSASSATARARQAWSAARTAASPSWASPSARGSPAGSSATWR